MKKQRGRMESLVMAIWVAFLLAICTGWIWNIVKLVHMDFSHIGGMLVVRAIGVFVAPLGAVMGFL